MDYLRRLQERMEISESLLKWYSEYGVFVPDNLSRVPVDSSDESLDRAIDEVNKWFKVTETIIAEGRPEDDPDLREFRNRGEKAYGGWDPELFLVRKLKTGQNVLDSIIEVERIKMTREN